jgi:outer membrane protein assembly factor BamE (lipoprotein component of BamABCDE complex)
MTDDNLWIYIERTRTRGKLLKLGRNYIKKNNVLVLEFDKYGILKDKKLFNKDDMKKISFAKDITENEIRKENFIYSFLSSIRQKMLTKRK